MASLKLLQNRRTTQLIAHAVHLRLISATLTVIGRTKIRTINPDTMPPLGSVRIGMPFKDGIEAEIGVQTSTGITVMTTIVTVLDAVATTAIVMVLDAVDTTTIVPTGHAFLIVTGVAVAPGHAREVARTDIDRIPRTDVDATTGLTTIHQVGLVTKPRCYWEARTESQT
jgi:hypothetical protein